MRQYHGMHVVTVLSGAITIVDRECNTRTYGPGPGESLGGEGPHLASNHDGDPAHMAVTYVLDPGWSTASGTVFLPPPAGCTNPLMPPTAPIRLVGHLLHVGRSPRQDRDRR